MENRNISGVSDGEMSLGILVGNIINIQAPNIKKALATFLLCSEMMRDVNRAESETKALNNALLQLGELLKKLLEQEEQILFPYLNTIALNKNAFIMNELPISIKKIKSEHLVIKRLFEVLRLHTNDYNPSAAILPSLKLCFAQFFNFEQDVLKYFFLEEERLFPKLEEVSRFSKVRK